MNKQELILYKNLLAILVLLAALVMLIVFSNLISSRRLQVAETYDIFPGPNSPYDLSKVEHWTKEQVMEYLKDNPDFKGTVYWQEKEN